jgi:hypothetical protein
MRAEKQKRGCGCVVLRAFMLPVVVGLLVGFVAVLAAFHIGQQAVTAESLTRSLPTRTPMGSTRVVILLLDGRGDDIIGVWQWWSDPVEDTGKAACILSPETRIAPSGRTVAEMMHLAMAAGDDAWVAKNTRDFAGDCLLGQASIEDEVIFVSESGMIELIDALGGIQIEKRRIDGARAWDYLVSSAVGPPDAQRRQQAVWVALKAAAKRVPRWACDQVTDTGSLFWSVPSRENPCHQLETVLVRTPPYIGTP